MTRITFTSKTSQFQQFNYYEIRKLSRKTNKSHHVKLNWTKLLSICFVNYQILCSKCKPLADTHAWNSLTEISMAFCGKLTMQTKSAATHLNLKTIFSFGCNLR